MRISLVPDRITRRSVRQRRISMLAAFGGAFGGVGLIGLFSTGPGHHPVFDTVLAVLGVEAAALSLFVRYRCPDLWEPVTPAPIREDRV